MITRTDRCDTNRLRHYFEETLAEPERRDVLAHLDDCSTCQARLEELAAAKPWWDEVRRFAPGATGTTRTEADPAVRPTALNFLEPAAVPGDLGQFGRFRVLDLIGQGGMGIVLRAFDPTLFRVVAIKVMAPHLAAGLTARRRFIREARAAASVSHDHVVAIHSVDEVNGLPYILMHYVAGKSLQERINLAGPLALEEILRIGLQIAAGLAAAHAQGLIHRDIKPANILLENSVERVKITDFGLALSGDDAPSAEPGDLAGTPQYMAPEQARGETVDHRADLFSLGAVMYAMSTGESPFRAPTVMGVLRRVCDDHPRPIRATNPNLPDWLDTIIARLLAKNPTDRPQTADEVVTLLSHRLASIQRADSLPLPSIASTPPRRRGRWVATLAGVVLFALVVGVAGVVITVQTGDGLLVVEADDPNVTVEVDGNDLGVGTREIRLKVGGHLVRAFRNGEPALDEVVTIERGGRRVIRVHREPTEAARLPVQPVRPPAAVEVFRTIPTLTSPKQSLADLQAEVWTVAYSSDGRRLAWAGKSREIFMIERPDGPPRRFDAGEFGVQSLAFSPDGQTLAVGDLAGGIRLCDASTLKVIRTMVLRLDFQVFSVSFSPDGRTIAAGGRSGLVGIFDVATGEPLPAPPAQNRPVSQVRFTPDGRTLLVATGDWDHPDAGGDVTLWKVGSNAFLGRLGGHKGRVAALAVSPDGQWIASGSNDGVRLWDAATLALTGALRVRDWQVNFLAFSPDGRTLASGQNMGQATLWDVATRRPLVSLLGSDRAISSVAFAPDGGELAMGGFDGSLRLWDLANQPGPTGLDASPTPTPDRFETIVTPLRPGPDQPRPDK